MSTTRVFLLASALARLIEKERGGQLVRQGFFSEETGRSTHVQVTGETGYLILNAHHADGPLEEPAEISRPQAEALLDLTAGRTEHRSIPIDISSHTAIIQRFVAPGPLDLISMAFRDDKAARKFQPPAWFGPEVSADPTYKLRSVALTGRPAVPEVEITNAALASLLDALDHRDQEAEPTPAQRAPAPAPAEVPFDAEHERELDGLNIEDSVIRDLARSLQPQGR
jgi:CYTH domain-containing protein